MKFKPLGERIVVKPHKADNVINGVILPDSAVKQKNIGEIVATGKGKVSDGGEIIPLDVKVGDVIMYSPRNHAEIELDGEKYLVMVQADIVGIGYE